MARTLPLVFVVLLAASAAAQPQLGFETIATGLRSPVSITHAGDTRLFITLQEGLVMIYDGTRVLPEPFLDVRDLVSSGGERGLLSIAFHPRYADNGLFFVDYTNKSGDTVIERYRVSADPNRADRASARQILFVDQPFANHNGGQLQFGRDGFLYIGMGDGGSGGDPGNRAQSRDTLLGKLLRIDVETDPYTIPPTNPYAHGGGRPEIWAVGLRNPWRFSFDRLTFDLWLADVGQGSWEEIDVQPSGSTGGENYGWRRMEGTHCYDPATNCDDGSFVLPVIEYGHTGGACSVTGGYVYRGTRFPAMQGVYFYGDYCNGKIWGATRTGTIVTSTQLADTSFLISTFGEDVNGELYVADYNGRVHRLIDTSQRVPRRRAVRH